MRQLALPTGMESFLAPANSTTTFAHQFDNVINVSSDLFAAALTMLPTDDQLRPVGNLKVTRNVTLYYTRLTVTCTRQASRQNARTKQLVTRI